MDELYFILYMWFSTGLVSAVITSFSVVYPSRKMTVDYIEKDVGLHKTNFYMFRPIGVVVQYISHIVLASLAGPVFGFLSTLSRKQALHGYTKSLIRSCHKEMREWDEEDY